MVHNDTHNAGDWFMRSQPATLKFPHPQGLLDTDTK